MPLFVGVDPGGPWLEWAPQKLNFTKQTHPKEQILFVGPGPILIANTSIWWSRPCGLGVGVRPPKIKYSKQTRSKEQLLFGGGEGKNDYKDCFRSQKHFFLNQFITKLLNHALFACG